MTLGEFAKGAVKVIGLGCVGMSVMRDPDMGVTTARDMWLAGNDEYAALLMRFAEAGFEYQKRDPLAGV